MKKRYKRIITYRILSIFSEFMIVYIATGSLLIPTITTPLCILTHTGIHYMIERIWKDKNDT